MGVNIWYDGKRHAVLIFSGGRHAHSIEAFLSLNFQMKKKSGIKAKKTFLSESKKIEQVSR